MAGWQVFYHWVNHWVNQLWSHMIYKWFALKLLFVCFCDVFIPLWNYNKFLGFHIISFGRLPTSSCQCQQLHKSVWIVSKCGPSQNRTCNISPRHRGQKDNVVLIYFYTFYCSKSEDSNLVWGKWTCMCKENQIKIAHMSTKTEICCWSVIELTSHTQT